MTVNQCFDLMAFLKTQGQGEKPVKCEGQALIHGCGFDSAAVSCALDGSDHYAISNDISVSTAIEFVKA